MTERGERRRYTRHPLPPKILKLLSIPTPNKHTPDEKEMTERGERRRYTRQPLPANVLKLLSIPTPNKHTPNEKGISDKKKSKEMNVEPTEYPAKNGEDEKGETAPEINQRRILPPKYLKILGITDSKTGIAQQEEQETETQAKRMKLASNEEPRFKHTMVRKELFKVPSTFNKSRRTTRSSTTFKPLACRKSLKNDFRNLAVPLPNDQNENLAFNFESTTIKEPVFQFGKNKAFSSTQLKEVEINKKKTPLKSTLSKPMEMRSSTSSTDSEFLALEKQCEMSPMASMCNLLSNTAISSTKKLKTKNEKLNIEDSIRMVKEIRDNYMKFHLENMKKINTILENLEAKLNIDNNKENAPKRSSPRLNAIIPQTKSPIKVLNSPKMSKGDNLRKATLTRNLSKSLQNLETPRTKKALHMYNNLRRENDILTTPNFKKIRDEEVQIGDSLSLTIQNQCLMLQDTPLK